MLRRQPARTDRLTPRIQRNDVMALRIERVQLQLQRHALFLHEYRYAHRAQLRQRRLVIDGLDGECRFRRGDDAHSSSSPPLERL
ncbi:hypothetical protein GCM10027159_12990 [Lysobacter terrae]